MKFTVQNNNLLYSVSFIEETARIGIQDLWNGQYESVISLSDTVWHIVEPKRQQFDTYHQGQIPITENQLGNQEMGLKVAVVIGPLSLRYWMWLCCQLRSWKHSAQIFLGGRANSKQLDHYIGGMSGIKPRDGKQFSPNSFKNSS